MNVPPDRGSDSRRQLTELTRVAKSALTENRLAFGFDPPTDAEMESLTVGYTTTEDKIKRTQEKIDSTLLSNRGVSRK